MSNIIGVAGGIGSGKSTVAKIIADNFKIPLVCSDKINHELLDTPEVAKRVYERFGESVILDGRVNRGALRKIIRENPDNLRALCEIVDPLIGAKEQEIIDSAPWVVLDSPLLFESGRAKECRFIIFVDTPYEERLRRVLARGWTEDDLKFFESQQMPLEDKLRDCWLIKNHGSEEELKMWVDLLCSTLQSISRRNEDA